MEGECCVCLDNKYPVRSRCKTCGIKTCMLCDSKLFHLCSICERSILNSEIICYSCDRPFRMLEFQNTGDFFLCNECLKDTSDSSDEDYIPEV